MKTFEPKYEWQYKEDPHGIIPVGFQVMGEKIIGFSAPAGLVPITKVRVIVESGTTRSYVVALHEFLNCNLQSLLTKLQFRI